jgi:hypothetical protein
MYLNSVRPNLTACCEYPGIVIWDWQYQYCQDYCDAHDTGDDRCCTLVCAMNTLGVLSSITEPSDVNCAGLVGSFLMSVGNDSQWLPVINASVTRCFSQMSGSNTGYDCTVVPNSLYAIADCSYKENYLKCPNWNPNKYEACTYSHDYIEKCF